MKIHSDTLTTADVYAYVSRVPGMHVSEITSAGSRKRARSWNVYLNGSSTSQAQHVTENGWQGRAATYEQWGWYLAEIFAADARAIAGPYDGRDDFHAQTKDAFQPDMIPGNAS